MRPDGRGCGTVVRPNSKGMLTRVSLAHGPSRPGPGAPPWRRCAEKPPPPPSAHLLGHLKAQDPETRGAVRLPPAFHPAQEEGHCPGTPAKPRGFPGQRIWDPQPKAVFVCCETIRNQSRAGARLSTPQRPAGLLLGGRDSVARSQELVCPTPHSLGGSPVAAHATECQPRPRRPPTLPLVRPRRSVRDRRFRATRQMGGPIITASPRGEPIRCILGS